MTGDSWKNNIKFKLTETSEKSLELWGKKKNLRYRHHSLTQLWKNWEEMSTAYTFLNGINISAEIAVFNSMGVLPLSLWGQQVDLEVKERNVRCNQKIASS